MPLLVFGGLVGAVEVNGLVERAVGLDVGASVPACQATDATMAVDRGGLQLLPAVRAAFRDFSCFSGCVLA